MRVTVRAVLDWVPHLCLLVLGAWPLWPQFSQSPHVLKFREDLSRGLTEEQNCSRWRKGSCGAKTIMWTSWNSQPPLMLGNDLQ